MRVFSFHDLDPEGQGACNDATINLAPGACMDLNCTQNDDCIDLVVNLNGGICWFNMFNQEIRPNFVNVCNKTNSSQCGPITPQEICCRDDPSCASCCVDVTTSTSESGQAPSSSTTTTTTTKTKTIYPRNRRNRRNRREHRRNRRQNRRNRRQHARQYRYS